MDTLISKLQVDLSSAYASFLAVVNQLDVDNRRQPGVCGDWSPKDIIAHLIGWDTALQAFISAPDQFDPNPLYDVDAFNANAVAERKQLSWDETIIDLHSSFANLQQAIGTVSAEMVIYDRVAAWLKGRTSDYALHQQQIEVWLRRDDAT